MSGERKREVSLTQASKFQDQPAFAVDLRSCLECEFRGCHFSYIRCSTSDETPYWEKNTIIWMLLVVCSSQCKNMMTNNCCVELSYILQLLRAIKIDKAKKEKLNLTYLFMKGVISASFTSVKSLSCPLFKCTLVYPSDERSWWMRTLSTVLMTA